LTADELDLKILEHYRSQAEKHGASPASTMEDEVIRAKELEILSTFFSAVVEHEGGERRAALEVGCGNGYTLSQLSAAFPGLDFSGLDFSPELLAIARQRLEERVPLKQGDVRHLPFDDARYDVVYTERCLINVMSWGGQQQALAEIARVLKPGGLCLLIECFTDGLANNNKARTECGLEPLSAAHHNLYFEPEAFDRHVAERFEPVDPDAWAPERAAGLRRNFLSSHYFVARVLHPLVTKGPWVRNTEFVKFFSFLAPVGNYSPIQAVILRRSSLR
jgi:ubiquinone/menaquinone biosynthesis C-methylase UbiE